MVRKSLVTYLAIGAAARTLCELSISCVRRMGWDGDIAILSDAPVAPGDARVHTVEVPAWQLNLNPDADSWGYEFDIRDMSRANNVGDVIKQLTPVLHRYIDISGYDLVLQLDVDIVPVSPMPEIFNVLFDMKNDFGVSRNERSELKRVGASAGNLSFWEHLRYSRGPVINSGIFFYRPSQVSMNILRDWQAELCRRVRGDQAALQAILFRKWKSQIDILEENFQAYPPTPRRYKGIETLQPVHSYFAHFRGAVGDPVVMKDYIKKFGILDAS
ncbi:putative nucleotide-diphospho-sugar transferase [Mangrovicoccus algicola]|uniref:Nucleotide-diphospho-sugar transferase domain-containing protein n=1 Tax=Mangrovicoccus algicola TaxID=2771008 RepID=A0A8J6YZH9_9RHOB|nr:putative nucleotide-diphospho-sugar transferase [Mangrovicoccus algicola]MBE3638708.1 hypothetical protein [Mangrovicoccus algicola]